MKTGRYQKKLEKVAGKIEVTLVGTLPPLLGVSEVCLGLINSLKGKVDLEFFAFEKLFPTFLHPAKVTTSGEPRYKGEVKVYYVISYLKPWTWVVPALKGKGKIIHLQWWTTFLFIFYFPMLLLARARRKKIIVQVHNVLPHEAKPWDKKLTSLILRMADKIILHTETMREMLISTLPEVKNKIEIIPYGPLSLYPDPGISQKEAKKAIDVSPDSKVVLFFGNIRQYKGVETLLEAFREVLLSYPDATLVIAGRVWGKKDPWTELIGSLGIQDRVRFMAGYISGEKVPVLFKAADVVVLPYKKFSSLSGVAMVALGFGKALVLSNVGSLREISPDSEVLFKPNDSKDLKRALLRVLGDESFQKRLETKAREIASHFSWESVSRKLVELYKDIV